MSHISSLLSHSVAPKSEYVKNYKNVSVTRPFHASPNQTDWVLMGPYAAKHHQTGEIKAV